MRFGRRAGRISGQGAGGRVESPRLLEGNAPTLFTAGGNSLGERVQKEVSRGAGRQDAQHRKCKRHDGSSTRAGQSDLLLCGNDAAAKEAVKALLAAFGWKSIQDLGDITGARGMEAYLLLWLRLYGVLKTADFNIRIVR